MCVISQDMWNSLLSLLWQATAIANFKDVRSTFQEISDVSMFFDRSYIFLFQNI